MKRHPLLMLGAVLGLVLGACFTGVATLGGICTADDQCGVGQTCTNAVCGMCKDGAVQAGEICFGPSSEEFAFGEVTDLLSIDIDFDGQNDLLAVVNDDCAGAGGQCWNVQVLLPDPDGSGDFETFALYEVNLPGRVPEMVVANFDGVGPPDIAAVIVPLDIADDNSQLAVLHDFPMAGTSVDIDIPVFARSLEAADLDGNGLDDLIVGSAYSNTLVIIPSTGAGFGIQQVLISDFGPRLATPVDMDGDGDLDLVLGSAIGATVGIDLNDGNGNFTPQPRQQLGAGVSVEVVATADFDGDGNLDLVALASPTEINPAPAVIAVYRGLGNGQLELLQMLPGGEYPIDVLTDDINMDGLPDIVIADLFEDKLPVFLNRAGSFPDRVEIDVAAVPVALLRDDFDFDGVDDLVIGSANAVISVVRSEN